MKQHITNEQLDELSDSAMKKLVTLSKNSKDLQEEIDEGGYDPDSWIHSIGQMIEFLQSNAELNELSYYRTDPYWRVSLTNRSLRRGDIGHWWSEPNLELVDALWSAVKEVLENKK